VLLIRVKAAKLTASSGVFGSGSAIANFFDSDGVPTARCDPYVTVKVNGGVITLSSLG
jgi:hypothetical protein